MNGHAREALLAVAACAVLAPAGAAAGTVDPAQQLFQQGVEAAQHDNWDSARDAFEKARSLSSRPVILVNLAGAQARTGHLKESVASYRAIIDDTTDEAAPFRGAALNVLKTLNQRLPRLQIRTTVLGPDDVVALDGEPLARETLTDSVPVDPGTHVVTVSRRGGELARISVSLAEGETHEVVLPAALLAARPAVEAARPALDLTSPAETASSGPAPSRSWWRSPWLWTGVALAAGAVTTTVILTSHETAPAYSGSVGPGIVRVQ